MGFLRFLKQGSFATQGVEVGFMVFETSTVAIDIYSISNYDIYREQGA